MAISAEKNLKVFWKLIHWCFINIPLTFANLNAFSINYSTGSLAPWLSGSLDQWLQLKSSLARWLTVFSPRGTWHVTEFLDSWISRFQDFWPTGLAGSALHPLILHFLACLPWIIFHNAWNNYYRIFCCFFLENWWFSITPQLWIPSEIWNNHSGTALVKNEPGSKQQLLWLNFSGSNCFTLGCPKLLLRCKENPTRNTVKSDLEKWFA